MCLQTTLASRWTITIRTIREHILFDKHETLVVRSRKKQTPEPVSLPERESSSKGLCVLEGDLRQ